jgi:hypothetical protein
LREIFAFFVAGIAICGAAKAAPSVRVLGGGSGQAVSSAGGQTGSPATGRAASLRRPLPARATAGVAKPAASTGQAKPTPARAGYSSANSRLSSSSFLAGRGQQTSASPGSSGGNNNGGGHGSNNGNYAQINYVDNLVNSIQSRISAIENDLADKADKAATYAKSETYSAQEIDSAIAGIRPGGAAVCAGQGNGNFMVSIVNGIETCAAVKTTGDVFIE